MNAGRQSIGRRVTRGGLALVFGQAASRLASTAGLLVVAGILSPADFGIVGIATFSIAAVNSVFAVGAGSAILVLPRGTALDRTALAASLAVGAGTCLLILATAPFLASLIGDGDAAPYLRALAPTLVLARWTEVRRAMLERDFRFGQATAIEVTSAVSGITVAILSAKAGAGPWALVLEELTVQGLMAAALTVHRAGPRTPAVVVPELRRLWSYCRHLLVNSMLLFAYSNLDNAAVARVAGTRALGLYAFAFGVTNAPVYVISHTVNRAMLPAYTSLRDAGQEWGPAYGRMLRVVAWLTGTILMGVLLHGPRTLTEVYGERWEDSYGAVRVLALYGLARAVGATTGTVFLAAGQPRLVSRIAQWQTLAMLVLIVPALVAFGIVGAAVAVTAPLMVAAFYALRRSSLIVGSSPWTNARSVLTIWAAVALCNLIAVPVTTALPGWVGLMAGGLVVAVGSLTYGLVSLRADVTTLLKHLRARRAPVTPPSHGVGAVPPLT